VERAHHKPNQLSGGQQQRVAIARAMVNRPQVILADEPTGNLDSHTGADILAEFQRLHREMDQTIVMITHDPAIAAYAARLITMKDGLIETDIANPRQAGVFDRLSPNGQENPHSNGTVRPYVLRA
jgi:putative ABC transport system ATP-binding protein